MIPKLFHKRRLMMTTKAIYPGTFDPLTNGHLNLIKRAARLFDIVILAIAANPEKCPLFDLDERVAMASEVTVHIPNVIVIGFKNLIAHFAYQQQGNILIRGIRTITDFDYEMQIAKMNKYLIPALETVLMISAESWSYLSSSLVKEIAMHGGNVDNFLHPFIAKEVLARLRHKQQNTQE